jgi:hypothetical protein
MRRLGQKTGLLGRATALVPVFALLVHIVAMALGAMGPPAPGGEIAQVHTHHSASAAGHDADGSAEDPEHKPPCCILSVCPGLPGPPVAHVLADLAQRASGALLFESHDAPTATRLLLGPLGARAPPALA